MVMFNHPRNRFTQFAKMYHFFCLNITQHSSNSQRLLCKYGSTSASLTKLPWVHPIEKAVIGFLVFSKRPPFFFLRKLPVCNISLRMALDFPDFLEGFGSPNFEFLGSPNFEFLGLAFGAEGQKSQIQSPGRSLTAQTPLLFGRDFWRNS